MEFTAEKNQIILNKYWNSKNRFKEPSKKSLKNIGMLLKGFLRDNQKRNLQFKKKIIIK